VELFSICISWIGCNNACISSRPSRVRVQQTRCIAEREWRLELLIHKGRILRSYTKVQSVILAPSRVLVTCLLDFNFCHCAIPHHNNIQTSVVEICTTNAAFHGTLLLVTSNHKTVVFQCSLAQVPTADFVIEHPSFLEIIITNCLAPMQHMGIFSVSPFLRCSLLNASNNAFQVTR
jgi:hypothetical protein